MRAQKAKYHAVCIATNLWKRSTSYEKTVEKEQLAEGITAVKGMAKIEMESPFLRPHHARKRTPQPLCHVDTKAEIKRGAFFYVTR
jgi:hypothetical protein